MSKTKRKLLSQNFLWNRELVSKLVRDSSISQNDVVLEIGPGTGMITEQLLGLCKKLTAFEVDRKLLTILKRKFPAHLGLSLLPGNFLAYPLPSPEPFKVFSNIPFSITGEIIKKLLFSQNPPIDSYLVIQTEAVDKYVARNSNNSMLAILFYPWFDIKIVYRFQRSDFEPSPRVDSCLVRIEKRNLPLVDEPFRQVYRDFVVYHFVRNRSAKCLAPNEWLERFDIFLRPNDPKMKARIKSSFDKWRSEEKELSKIHRTRTDKHWKDGKF